MAVRRGRDVAVRDAAEADLPAVAALLREVFYDEGWGGRWRAPALDGVRLQASTGILLVAEDRRSRDLLGSAGLVTLPSPFAELASAVRAEVTGLAVRASARGRGVAHALIRECLARAAGMGLEETALTTRAEMRAAAAVYERAGFRRRHDLDFRVADERRLAYVASLARVVSR